MPAVSTDVFHVEPMFDPAQTIPRVPLYDERGPVWAALAVGEFIGAPLEQGNWRTQRFEVSEEAMKFDYLRAHGDGKGRWTAGWGEFVALHRVESGTLVMSNTPQEMKDLEPVFLHATGRVLVHGLGLSCVVSALLAKSAVEHIDVVEIEQDVIDLVGPAYEKEDRVTIHQGDCLTFDWPSGTRWDYVWHDIWSEISEDNLSDPEEAEFGITYEMLHRRFGQRCDQQGSWGFPEAQGQRRRRQAADRYRQNFKDRWPSWTFDERVDALVDFQRRSMKSIPGFVTRPSLAAAREMFRQLGTLEKMEESARSDEAPGIWVDW